MTYYYVCPDCGSNLDPGEKCDCARKEKKEFLSERLKIESSTGQLVFDLNKMKLDRITESLNKAE